MWEEVEETLELPPHSLQVEKEETPEFPHL
jgi:hypothetical protein